MLRILKLEHKNRELQDLCNEQGETIRTLTFDQIALKKKFRDLVVIGDGPVYDIELNRVYSFNLPSFTWPGLSIDTTNTVCKNGAASSKYIEHMLCSDSFFPKLIYKDKPGYDYIQDSYPGLKTKLDLKNFTNGGSKFMPSSMIGTGRTVDKEEFHSHAKELTYIFCDIIDFPKIKVIFKDGEDLICKYPNGHIYKTRRNELFSDGS